MAGLSIHGMVKTQLEIAELEKISLYSSETHSSVCTECGMYLAEKTRGTGRGTAHQMFSDDLIFHLFPTFSPLPYDLKSARLNNIYILTRKSSLSERNFSPIGINTL